jgi:hypothetical protein
MPMVAAIRAPWRLGAAGMTGFADGVLGNPVSLLGLAIGVPLQLIHPAWGRLTEPIVDGVVDGSAAILAKIIAGRLFSGTAAGATRPYAMGYVPIPPRAV